LEQLDQLDQEVQLGLSAPLVYMDEPEPPVKQAKPEILATLEEPVKPVERVKRVERARKEMPVRKEFWE
jgi:hypothetical protein